MEKELEEDNKDIYHYESKIMHHPRENIWEIICNFHSLMTQQGIIKDCCMNPPITAAGSEISFTVCENNKKCRLKVSKYKMDKKNDKWTIGITPLCGPFAHIENTWTLIKISDNETLVTNTTKHSEHIDPELIKKLSDEKIKGFISIEEMLKCKKGENNKNSNINNNKDLKEDKKA
jgi:hypothetical protein